MVKYYSNLDRVRPHLHGSLDSATQPQAPP